jgi:hypothetical protein
MAIQDFTAGQVLTAVQMDNLQANDYNQTVNTSTSSYTLVAADKGTRRVMNSASATTITVNTSLFSAGDTLFLQNIGAGVCTVTAGTATVSSAGPLAIPQNGSGVLYFTSAGVSIYYPSAVTASASGLTLTAVETFSAVSSAAVNDCFSSTFNSYRVVFLCTRSTTNQITFRLRVGVTDDTSANYNYQIIRANDTTLTGKADNITSYTFNDATNASSMSAVFDIENPQIAVNTLAQGQSSQGMGASASASSVFWYRHSTTSQFTGLNFIPSTGTITGTCRVYGYKESL